ncbi:MAG: lysine biosynthesis protein LysW [Chloroflexota bacterium]|nr:lysine biosynthesis protein LysW [Chloroflexota bacterium]
MAGAFCPDCGHKISLARSWEGQLMMCPNCDAELEVISLDPPELDWAYVEEEEEDEEDWDEE